METKSNPVCNFTLEFDLDKRVALINWHGKDAPVMEVRQNFESKAFGNACVATWLGYYESFGNGLYLHSSFEDVRNGMAKNDNVGYVFGYALQSLLDDGTLTYTKEAELEDRSGNVLYRIRFDYFDFFPSEVPYRAFDEDEANYADHNRNALRAIRHLEVMQKVYAAGKNIELHWYEQDDPYFTGDNGLKNKYGLYLLSKTDPTKLEILRKLVNAGIASRKGFKATKRLGRLQERVAEGDETAAKLLVSTQKRIAEWKLLDVEGNELSHESLVGQVVQMSVGGTVLPQQFTVSEENLEKIVAGFRGARARVHLVPAEAVATKVARKPRGRNVPTPVSK